MHKIIFSLQVALAIIVAFVSANSLTRLYYAGVFSRDQSAVLCADVATTNAELASMLARINGLESKVKARISEEKGDVDEAVILSEVVIWLEEVRRYMLKLRVRPAQPMGAEQVEEREGEVEEEEEDELAEKEREKAPLVNFFMTEEMRKYLTIKDNRNGRKNFMGANVTVGAIGHACVAMKSEVEEYMEYDVGDLCKDDWPLAQRLMVHGCDPLPRRRCLARAPPLFQQPLPINQSLWLLPDNRNIRWARYACRNFQCLQNGTRKGFSKCSNCFNLDGHEAARWVTNTSSSRADFLIRDILNLKPSQIRIGLDFSVSVGTFAARMLEHNVTIVTSTLNLGAPFNELIALRGLIPLYISINQRLPFFDNTLDLIHTNLFLDGWIDLQFLDFVVFDWDRVLRPGGLLWIDKFFCHHKDLDDYLHIFLQLRYKQLKWVVAPKYDKLVKDQLFFSAVLEKPPRPF